LPLITLMSSQPLQSSCMMKMCASVSCESINFTMFGWSIHFRRSISFKIRWIFLFVFSIFLMQTLSLVSLCSPMKHSELNPSPITLMILKSPTCDIIFDFGMKNKLILKIQFQFNFWEKILFRNKVPHNIESAMI
jgi:hypothetical protein